MPTDALAAAPDLITPFEDILDDLERLSRDHLLFYRVEVGEVLLRHFWGSDAAAYHSQDPRKNQRFNLFFEKYHEALERYGLSKTQAAGSIRAHLVVRTLPPAMAQQLFLSQVLQLARLTDPTQRAEVAGAAIERDWSVAQLRDAVSAVRAGLSLEIDENSATLAPPEAEAPTRKVAPGRLVTRAERMVSDVQTWSAQWSTVDGSRLRRPQRRRLRAAMTALEAEVARMRAVLGADQPSDGGGTEPTESGPLG